VDGAADADPAAVVDGDPGGAGGGVEQGVEQGPVGDGVRAVGHGFGLPVGRGDRARVEVVPSDDDRRETFPSATRPVEQQPCLGAVAVAEPADACRQALELDVLGGGVEPAVKVRVVREQLLEGGVGDGDVGGSPESATQRNGPRPSQNSGRM
jgi:hypothetical protein